MDLFPVSLSGGTQPAITEINGNRNFQTYSYDELIHLITAFSHSLSTTIGALGDKCDGGLLVGIVMHQNAESICLLLACKALHISTLLLPPTLRTDKNEPLSILTNSRIRYLLSPPHTIQAWACDAITLKREIPIITTTTTTSTSTSTTNNPPQFSSFRLYEISILYAVPCCDDGFFRSHTSIIQLTSGSTGSSPKQAIRTWHAIQQEINADNKIIKINKGSNVVVVSALSHSYALIWSLVVLNNGGHLLVSSIHCLEFLKSFQVSFIFGIKATYESLLQSSHKDHPSYSPSMKEFVKSVRFACCAGAQLDSEIQKDCMEMFGLRILQNYGSTETGSIALDKSDSKSILDLSSGSLLPHLEIQVLPLDDSSGKCGGCTKTCKHDDCDWKATGSELLVRGEAVAVGYLLQGKIVACTDENGWYHTRDLVEIKGEPPKMYILGRLRNPLSFSGHLVNAECLQKKVIQTFVQDGEQCLVMWLNIALNEEVPFDPHTVESLTLVSRYFANTLKPYIELNYWFELSNFIRRARRLTHYSVTNQREVRNISEITPSTKKVKFYLFFR